SRGIGGRPTIRATPPPQLHGERRSNATHWSLTDLDALLTRKPQGEGGEVGLLPQCADREPPRAVRRRQRGAGHRDRRARGSAPDGARQRGNGFHPKTLGADKAYYTAAFVETVRAEGITPHVAEHITTRRGSHLDGRTTRHPGYGLSQRARQRIEEIFGWGKTIGGWRKSRYRGLQRDGLWAYLVAAAYNLIRLVKLMPATG